MPAVGDAAPTSADEYVEEVKDILKDVGKLVWREPDRHKNVLLRL